MPPKAVTLEFDETELEDLIRCVEGNRYAVGFGLFKRAFHKRLRYYALLERKLKMRLDEVRQMDLFNMASGRGCSKISVRDDFLR